MTERFREGRENQIRAIFASLFILQNRLQTAFDKGDKQITLKQFMLLILLKQAGKPEDMSRADKALITLTRLGELLGCSRQNVKKLASSLEQKGFVAIRQSPEDSRALWIEPTPRLWEYFGGVAEHHAKILNLLFQDYSEEEIEALFRLLTKLYAGTQRIEAELMGGDKSK